MRGDITWHAFPFNLQRFHFFSCSSFSELMDEQTYDYGASIAHDLDRYFGFTEKKVLSQR